jgi:hypothetical protein
VVFANQFKFLFAVVRAESEIINSICVVLGFAIDHCVLRFEATLGVVNGLAVGLPTSLSGDADVQRCGTICHEIPLNLNTANQGISRLQEPGSVKK